MPAFGTAFLLCPLSSTCSPFSLCECCIQKHKDTSGATHSGNASFLEHAFHRAQSNNQHGKFLNWTKQSGTQGNICGSRNVHRDMLGVRHLLTHIEIGNYIIMCCTIVLSYSIKISSYRAVTAIIIHEYKQKMPKTVLYQNCKGK